MRLVRGPDEGDFGIPEREYNAGEAGRKACFARPTEACNSVGTQSWGHREDEDYYSSAFLIQSIDAVRTLRFKYMVYSAGENHESFVGTYPPTDGWAIRLNTSPKGVSAYVSASFSPSRVAFGSA